MDCILPGFSVHGVFQARILKWVATSFFRGYSLPRGQTWISCTGRWVLYCLSPPGSPFLVEKQGPYCLCWFYLWLPAIQCDSKDYCLCLLQKGRSWNRSLKNVFHLRSNINISSSKRHPLSHEKKLLFFSSSWLPLDIISFVLWCWSQSSFNIIN